MNIPAIFPSAPWRSLSMPLFNFLARNSSVTNRVLVTLQMKRVQYPLQLAAAAAAPAPNFLTALAENGKETGGGGEMAL